MTHPAFVLLSGVLFGAGLAISTMARPESVLAFLHGADGGLLLVLGGAVAVALLAYQLGPRLLGKPLAGERFHPHPSSLDRRTVLGAAIFGAGWGLCGVCPGPAVASLGTANWPVLLALLGMLAGAFTQGRWYGR